MFFQKNKNVPSALHSSLSEKRKQRKRVLPLRGSKKSRLSLLLIFLVPLTFSLLFYLIFVEFSVKHIFCTDSENSSCPPELIEQLQQFQGKPLLFIHVEKSAKEIIQHFQQYDEFTWKRDFPNSLQFTPHKSPPSYTFTINTDTFLVLESGKVTAIEQVPEDIPQIKSEVNLIVAESQNLPEHIHSSIQQLFEQMKKNKLEVFETTWQSETEIVIELQSGKKLFVKSENLEDQFQKIIKILNREVEVKDWKELDVRFQHPVVR